MLANILHDSYPRMVLLWSDLLEMQVWRGVRGPRKVDIMLQKVARSIGHVVGHWICHQAMSHQQSEIFCSDRVRLSDQGDLIWLQDIQATIHGYNCNSMAGGKSSSALVAVVGGGYWDGSKWKERQAGTCMPWQRKESLSRRRGEGPNNIPARVGWPASSP